jgi:hypothetical protein
MKSVRLCSGIVLLAALLSAVSAQEVQHILVDNIQPALDPIQDSLIPGYTLDDPDKKPVEPPIWSLCANPSKHLLIPLFSPF